MDITTAQHDVRHIYRGGFMGQLVSALVWAASAAAATWSSPRTAILVLVIGGFFIFPLTTLGLTLLGGPASLPRDNPLGALGMQVAFVVPLCLPVILAVAHHETHWFYPAFMVVVGAHYLPFVFLYGMRMFAVLGFGLVALGMAVAHQPAWPMAWAAWLTAAVLVTAAVAGWALVSRELRERR